MFLFVYGSLLSSNSHHYLLKGCQFVGKAILYNFGLYRVSWYPAIVPKENSKVLGEVYDVDENTLRKIDEFEDEGKLYKRQEVEVMLDSGQTINAWAYVYLLDVDGKNYMPFDRQPWKG